MAENTPAAVVTPPVVETPKPVEIPAAVLERERQIRATQEKLQTEKAEVAKQLAEVNAWKADRAKEAEAKADPLEKIEKATNRLATLEQSIKQKEAAQALQTWKAAKIAEVNTKPDAYELIIRLKKEHLVPARIEDHWNRTGEMLSTDDVATQIEKELDAEVEQAVSSKKWKAKAVPPPPAPPPSAKTEEKKSREAPKTLTNGLTGVQTTPPAAQGKKTFAERKAATLAKWEAEEARKKAAAQ